MNRLIGAFVLGVLIVASACAQGTSSQIDDAFFRAIRAGADESAYGNVAAAMIETKAALALNPNRYEGWLQLGDLLGEMGDFEGAEAALRRAIQLKPDVAKVHYELALALIGNPQGKMDWAGAIAECRIALQYQPDSPQALDLLGAGLTATGQAAEAVSVLQHALQLRPTLAEAHFNLGMAIENQANTAENKTQLDLAAQQFRAAIEVRAAYPEAQSALGNVLFRMGKQVEAEQALDQALRINPDLTDAHYAMARLLRNLNRKSEAKVEFAETKDLTDRPANGVQSSQMSNLALELARKGDLAAAAVSLRKAIALKPDYGVPHYNLGLILADSGDTTGAIRELTMAISLLPGQSKPWFDLARVLGRAHDDRRALEAIAWAAKLDPGSAAIQSELESMEGTKSLPDESPIAGASETRPDVGSAMDTPSAHLAYALKLKSLGENECAVGELLRALSLSPANIDARRNLVEAYRALGDTDHAILESYKVLRSASEDVETRIALAKMLLTRGDSEEATNQLHIALRSNPDSVDGWNVLKQAEKVIPKP